MSVLFLLTNSVCDITCSYCFYTTGHEKRSKARVLPEIAKNVANRVVAAGFRTVILTGGDPLHSRYKKETFELIRLLKERNCKVIVNTSGVRLEDCDFDSLIELKVDRIDISIDSHLPDIHNQQRGLHADSVRAISELLNRGYRNVTTTTVVTEANASTLVETVAWLRSLGVEDVRIQRAFLPTDQKASGVERYIDTARKDLTAPHVQNYLALTKQAFRGEEPHHAAICRMGKDYFVCDANGLLSPCFHRSDIVIGNLFTDSTELITNGLRAHELAEAPMPACFGKHCVSLFDNPKFWREP